MIDLDDEDDLGNIRWDLIKARDSLDYNSFKYKLFSELIKCIDYILFDCINPNKAKRKYYRNRFKELFEIAIQNTSCFEY